MHTAPARLNTWYVHRRRISEAVGADTVSLAGVGHGEMGDDAGKVSASLARITIGVTKWLARVAPPTFEQLLINGKIEEGAVCTLHRSFFSKGLVRFLALKLEKQKTAQPPFLHSRIPLDDGNHRVEVPFYPEHLTSTSAHSELSGRGRFFVLGTVAEVEGEVTRVRPWIIASVSQDLGSEADAISSFSWGQFREIQPQAIDQFQRMAHVQWPKSDELPILGQLSEATIKRFVAEIIGEQEVPKDWGGETSDLFSSRLSLSGRSLTTAFAFKGPGSKRKEMTLASLGKNGDQISRLFSEPAELLVLQHWGTFHRGIVDHMRAHANQIHNPRFYMMLDGYKTLALLRAYGKI
jgi:hypothetical protein